jgi:hypothetical protein
MSLSLDAYTYQRRSMLERLPTWVICIPLTLQWLWLSLCHRSATLPSVANPHITAGGLVGEGKLEYFQEMGEVARAATARHCALNTNISYTPSALIHVMTAKNLTFPIIAKPNLGLCGFGVRLIANVNELETYLKDFPMGEAVVLQEYLSAEGEAGIFYARHPHEDKGQIIGLTLRHYPRVIGDGKKTIAQLIAANPRAQRLLLARHHQCSHLSDSIPTKEHVVRLATIGSTRVGGLYEDGAAYITPALTHAIDAIARDMPHFYFGRFDVRFASLEEISKGQHFKIMEINGAGSEAIQAWDPNTSLWTAFSIIFAKQRLLFTIGAANRAKGYQPISLRQLAALHFRQRGLIENYPPSN